MSTEDNQTEDLESPKVVICKEPTFAATIDGFYIRRLEGSPLFDRLTNFHCKVTKEVILEGIKTNSVFTIWAGIPKTATNTEPIQFTYENERVLEVKSKEFHSGKWVNELGGDFVLYPLKFPASYVNMIAQTWRPERTVQKVCQIIGFKSEGDKIFYVSGNDIIGDYSGIEALPLQGSHKLAKYGLKQTSKIELEKSLINSLGFLDLGSLKITAPLYCAVWRAPLCYWKPFQGILTLVGRTGSFKSSIGAKALSHFGAFVDNTDLPLKWNDTVTALNVQLSSLRDTLVVIDDFNPEFSKSTKDSMANTLSMILGDSGDGIARKRANSDLTLRDSFVVRNLIVSTAEIIPNIPESRLARMLVIELNEGNKIDRSGLFNYDPTINTALMRMYIDWLRLNPPTFLEEKYREFKNNVTDKGIFTYERTGDLYANLMVGLYTFDQFLRFHGYKVEEELYENVHDALVEICKDQNSISDDEPKTYYDMFLDGIRTLVNEDRVYIKPKYAKDSVLGNERKEMIGWYDDDNVYLSFNVAVTVLNNYRTHNGKHEIPLRTLASELKQKGLNVSKMYRFDKYQSVRACLVSYHELFSS